MFVLFLHLWSSTGRWSLWSNSPIIMNHHLPLKKPVPSFLGSIIVCDVIPPLPLLVRRVRCWAGTMRRGWTPTPGWDTINFCWPEKMSPKNVTFEFHPSPFLRWLQGKGLYMTPIQIPTPFFTSYPNTKAYPLLSKSPLNLNLVTKVLYQETPFLF